MIAIVASVIAAFAKDFIGLMIGKISDTYRARKERKDLAREKYIERTASDPALLIVSHIRTLRAYIILLGFTLIVMLCSIYVQLIQQHRVAQWIVSSIAIIGLALEAGFSYRATNYAIQDWEASRIYRSNLGKAQDKNQQQSDSQHQ